MKRFLDILLIVLITILLINLFSEDKEKDLDNKILFEFSDNSYTIPASVGIKASNNTSDTIVFNTCDLKIINSGEPVNFDKSFCKDINLKSGSSSVIEYSSEYSKFDTVGKYTLNFKYDGKEYIDQFELENSGSIKKIFVSVFYAPIYNLLIFLLNLFSGSFGLAIVGITIIIRIVLLWPQHKMMVSQKKLQAIQPKIKEIQEKYKGQQQILGMKLMELYKTEKVNPMGSCGFLIIQMPILLVIYHIILGIKDPSNYFYIYSFLSAFDLESINYNFMGLDLLASGGIAGLILALVVAFIQYIQIKLSLSFNNNNSNKKGVVLEKKSPSEGYNQFMPDPELINKFMLYGMPVMVAIFTFSLFAGVGIYWGISTLFMLFQQLFVNKILQK